MDGTIRVETRQEALRKYVEWLSAHPEMIQMMERFLKGKRLACHCDDEMEDGKIMCHGQIIVAILEGMNAQDVKLWKYT